MKEIVILGSTGSIGTQTLEVISNNKDMHVKALAAGSNTNLVEKQVNKFMPELVCIYNNGKALELKKCLEAKGNHKTKVVTGMDGLVECATIDGADIVVAAVSGMIGIKPVIEAIKTGKDIAFANKETLVTAGHIIMPMVHKYGVKLLPVDSEHSAIFQCISGKYNNKPARIILTASGGPFRGMKKEALKNIMPEDALKHPNWSMGKKITVDSSTMVNKGLEVIEAKWLFNMDFDNIEVVIQPQSIIHSMVEFEDGAVIAQLGTPDMKLPIQYALTYPERRYLPGERLDFYKMSQITFEKPDLETFEGLKLAYEAGQAGGSMLTVFNAANEKAVAMFLERKAGYLDITRIIKECMQKHKNIDNPSLSDILEIEQDVYSFIESM
ncbi:MAG: 1-deoxy-D-xylulose-5-phosphate reductoisomerase [Lachnospiraceae bacterium]